MIASIVNSCTKSKPGDAEARGEARGEREVGILSAPMRDIGVRWVPGLWEGDGDGDVVVGEICEADPDRGRALVPSSWIACSNIDVI